MQYYTPLSDPDHIFSYVGVSGFGAYPGVLLIRPDTASRYSITPGTDLEGVTFFYTSLGVRNYQGLKLITEYPEKGVTHGGRFVVNQDPAKVRDYFDVNIEPGVVLLGPSWPIFSEDWTKKVKVTIHVKEGTPNGKYLIGLRPVTPDPDFNTEMFKKYRFRYQTASSIATEAPPYQIFVQVG